jgi:hypothetical protein
MPFRLFRFKINSETTDTEAWMGEPTQGHTTQHRKLRAYIRAPNGIRTHSPTVRAVQGRIRLGCTGTISPVLVLPSTGHQITVHLANRQMHGYTMQGQ